ncbi:hypothetical protein [Roseobacter weihaiensis]|uniref:hypothetical protein n=1 Tax=Roseobacter weihaiensis TaxID=2763262 RepID=UPI001D0AE0C6|nr:hypothetical protein [Roseobacter sp. H9]
MKSHSVFFDENSGRFVVHRVRDGKAAILAEFSLSEVENLDFDDAVDTLAKRIGEILILDNKIAVKKLS